MEELPYPLFSVIMPTHNRCQLLSTAIDSVINQQYEDWELLIVDDGSTDGTEVLVSEYMRKDNRVKYFYQEHQERSSARNRGIQEANGKYICFLDDDDYYLAIHLSTFFNVLQDKGFSKIILRTGFMIKDRGNFAKTSLYEQKNDLNPVRFAAFKFVSACTLCIPTQFLNDNRFPKLFRHWQDTHLILRLFAQFPFLQLPAFSYIYVIHPKMGSNTIYQYPDAQERIQNNINAIKDLFDHHGAIVNPFLPGYTKDYLICQKYLAHSHGALKNGNLPLMQHLFRKSITFNKGFWFLKGYIKVLVKSIVVFFLKRS